MLKVFKVEIVDFRSNKMRLFLEIIKQYAHLSLIHIGWNAVNRSYLEPLRTASVRTFFPTLCSPLKIARESIATSPFAIRSTGPRTTEFFADFSSRGFIYATIAQKKSKVKPPINFRLKLP